MPQKIIKFHKKEEKFLNYENDLGCFIKKLFRTRI